MDVRRLLAFVTLVALGCAAAPQRDRLIVLESAGYGCGAVESGLGCGVAIQPVLARIDELDGVSESRVSWDGSQFLLELEPGADQACVTQAAAAVLEGSAKRADPKAEDAAVASYRAGDRWLARSRTVELSRVEAREIANKYGPAVAREVKLDTATAEQLQAAMLEELTRTFEETHSEGGGLDRFRDKLRGTWERFEGKVAAFLTPAQRDHVGEILKRKV